MTKLLLRTFKEEHFRRKLFLPNFNLPNPLRNGNSLFLDLEAIAVSPTG